MGTIYFLTLTDFMAMYLTTHYVIVRRDNAWEEVEMDILSFYDYVTVFAHIPSFCPAPKILCGIVLRCSYSDGAG